MIEDDRKNGDVSACLKWRAASAIVPAGEALIYQQTDEL